MKPSLAENLHPQESNHHAIIENFKILARRKEAVLFTLRDSCLLCTIKRPMPTEPKTAGKRVHVMRSFWRLGVSEAPRVLNLNWFRPLGASRHLNLD